jgi:hypothetical protein
MLHLSGASAGKAGISAARFSSIEYPILTLPVGHRLIMLVLLQVW